MRGRRLLRGERDALRRAVVDVDGVDRDQPEEQHRLGRHEELQEAHEAPPRLRGQVGRHAVVDLDQDRRLARAHPGAQPETRLPVASDRPAGQALAVTVVPRRSVGALVAAVALAIAFSLLAALVAAGPAAAAGDGPIVRAPAAILVEPATGDVVFQRNAHDERPVASTTKLMTALLTLEREKLSTTVTTIRYRAAPAESVIGLRAGERMKVADLMRGLLLASANDAAATLAVRVGGTRERFVRLMNE